MIVRRAGFCQPSRFCDGFRLAHVSLIARREVSPKVATLVLVGAGSPDA
jgi:hypothetical protein